MHTLEEIKKNIQALQVLKQQVEARLEDDDELCDVTQLTKEERINKVWKLPKLSSNLMAQLEECGFITGSSVYSSGKPNDIDWCVNIRPTAFKHYTLGCTNQGYWEADGFTSVYGHYEGTLINIICFSDIDLMDAWYRATVVMKALKDMNVEQSPFSRNAKTHVGTAFDTKWKRVRMFRALKDIFTPVRALEEPLELKEALKYSKCKRCGQEAINFTCKDVKDRYIRSGICERCQSKDMI